MFDFRSDTVTQPDEPMRQAMAAAIVGDDVYGEDETVNALEVRVAEMLGKQAGLFVASGTQSNLLAMLTHAGRGDEVLSGKSYHVMKYEAGGMSALGGIMPCALPVTAEGSLLASDIMAAIKPDDSHFPVSRLLCLENTHNGMVQSVAQLTALCDLAKSQGLATHLDGARLMNAAVAHQQPVQDFAAPFHSISLCLSKGLGAPVGSVLVGDAGFIKKARRLRKMLGGGMRQSGILAAAGLYALDNNVTRLAEDHERAKRLAEALSAIEGVLINQSQLQSNMVYLSLSDALAAKHKDSLPDKLLEAGVRISGADPAYRLVIHKDITDEAIERLSSAMAKCLC